MERPKRVIAKPSRYKTTSSSEDEEVRRPSKKVPNPSTITDAEIDSDIGDLRRTLENDPSTNMDKTNYNIIFIHNLKNPNNNPNNKLILHKRSQTYHHTQTLNLF